jgi:hypothetical protein
MFRLPVKVVAFVAVTPVKLIVLGLANISTQVVVGDRKLVPVPVTVTPNEVPLCPEFGLNEIVCVYPDCRKNPTRRKNKIRTFWWVSNFIARAGT